MRVRAREDVRTTIADGRIHTGLTPADEYFVIEVDEANFRVVDDRGEPILYPKELFEILDPKLPADWQFCQYEDGAYCLGPVAAARPGFYEDFFFSDGNRAATINAQDTLRQILQAATATGAEEHRIISRDLKRLRSWAGPGPFRVPPKTTT